MKRLIDDPQIAGELRTEMQRYATERAQVDLKRVYTSLQASLPLAGAPSPASGGAWSGLSGVSKLLIVAAIGGSVAVGFSALRSDEPAASVREAPAAASKLAAPLAPTPQPTAALTPVATNEQLVTAASDLAPPTAGGLSPMRTALPSAAPSGSQQLQPKAAEASSASRGRANTSSASRREIAQLARIKALLEQDPAAARRLIRAAQREFPAGLLVEEREGLDVIALFALQE
ncbi:MAG TPA: hypothetical protein VMF89_01500, partial [Polyangiales bacterium]|nr:hypothetical protein [Polyangiales bacterium]